MAIRMVFDGLRDMTIMTTGEVRGQEAEASMPFELETGPIAWRRGSQIFGRFHRAYSMPVLCAMLCQTSTRNT